MISEYGGSIYETNTLRAGIYTCTVLASTTPNGYYDDSFTFSLTMSLPTVPDPPTDLTEITASTTSSSLEFEWIAPVNDGGSPITGYKIGWD